MVRAGSVVSSPNPGLGGNILNGVVAINTNNVWAVGASWDISGNNVQALIEHWNGKSWKFVSSPTIPEQLTAITRVSGTNQLWAVGLGGIIEHWDGTSWSVVSSPSAGTLKGVVANNANDVWAIGLYANPSQTLIEHWDGTNWSIVSSPNVGTSYNQLDGVTLVPGTKKLWAVGTDAAPSSGPGLTLTEHWNGINWSIVSSPNAGTTNNFLIGMAAISTRNIWAVGGFVNDPVSNNPQVLIEHWNGTRWSVVSSPSTGSDSSALEGVTRVPGNVSQLWTVGDFWNSSGSHQTLIEFYC